MAGYSVFAVYGPTRSDGTHGTYIVADYGYQSGQSFLAIDGPSENLVDGDLDFVLVGSSVNIVDKLTGDVVFWSHVDHAEEIMAMTPVPGHEPPDDSGANR